MHSQSSSHQANQPCHRLCHNLFFGSQPARLLGGSSDTSNGHHSTSIWHSPIIPKFFQALVNDGSSYWCLGVKKCCENTWPVNRTPTSLLPSCITVRVVKTICVVDRVWWPKCDMLTVESNLCMGTNKHAERDLSNQILISFRHSQN